MRKRGSRDKVIKLKMIVEWDFEDKIQERRIGSDTTQICSHPSNKI